MSHLVLAMVTIGIVRFAWVNFKRLGTVRAQTVELSETERQQLQMRYVTRILASLVALAVAPFLFTMFVK